MNFFSYASLFFVSLLLQLKPNHKRFLLLRQHYLNQSDLLLFYEVLTKHCSTQICSVLLQFITVGQMAIRKELPRKICRNSKTLARFLCVQLMAKRECLFFFFYCVHCCNTFYLFMPCLNKLIYNHLQEKLTS